MEAVDYDLLIIGGGPAGLTAGLYASRARVGTLMIEKIAPGGQLLATEFIENYPGFPVRLNGADLAQSMMEQAGRFGLAVESNEVMSVDLAGPVKKIQLPDRTVTARAVVIASGASPKKLGVPGEDRFYGRGVSTCSTCDGPFYKDRVVAAVGGGDTAVQESVFLTRFARKVYLIHRRDRFRAEAILQERVFGSDQIEVVWDTVVTRVEGESRVERIHTRNVKTAEEKELAVDACFIWIGIEPNIGFLQNPPAVDEFGFIFTDAAMATSIPGVFAAGDVRVTPVRQIATAVGDAAIAAISAQHYIENLRS